MKKFYVLFALLMCSTSLMNLHAQTINSPVPSTITFLSGASGVTFALENQNAGTIVLTDVSIYRDGAYGNASYTLWYSSTSLSGASTVNTPDWTQIASVTPPVISTSGVYPVFTGLTFNIPAATTYRFCIVSSNAVHYGSAAPGNSSAVSGVNMYVGDYTIASSNVGYSGSGANPPLGNNPRWFYGSVTTMPASPCTAPPVAGSASASNTTPCAGSNVDLGLTGNSLGLGQTYQWQSGPSATGPWTNIGTSQPVSNYTITPTATAYYQCLVTCGASTIPSAPVQVSVPPLFAAGTYTINSGLPTGGSNFNNFTDAVNAISCGITGPVVFNVAAGSGPYNEQVTIPHIATTSATNTITFNGNGRTLTYASANTNERAGIKLDGADYITINDLVVVPTGTYGFGIQLLNDADNNTINNCTINNINTSTSSNYACIVISGSATSATGTGSNCDSNTISNNTTIGGYYGITCLGAISPGLVYNNKILNNNVQDVYFYGIYVYGADGALVEQNEVSRPTRTSVSTFYGIYLATYSINCRISKNRIHNPMGAAPTSTSANYGIYVTGADATLGNENIISNNLIKFENGNGTQYAFYNSSSDYALYYHNTVSLENTASTSGATRGLYQITLATGIQFKNNIISITRGGSTAKYGIYKGTATTNIDADNNIYYINSATASTNHIGYSGSNQTTLAAWQTTTSGDLNSITTDPVFTSPATGNYAPTTALVDNLGIPVGITTDLLNTPRSLVTPDIGAYEFTATPLSAVSVNISAVNKGSYNLVNWNITSDIKYTSFELERSGDGERFTQLAVVAANTANEYAYNDDKPLTGINYYRIKTTDLSGKAAYSKVVVASVKDADLFTVEAYPNPVHDKFSLRLFGNQGSDAQVFITDIAGKLIRQLPVAGNETAIDMSGMEQGIYFIKYKDSLHDQTIRISKQ